MQEWLSKSGQNGQAQSQQQFIGLEQAQALAAAHQNMSTSHGGSSKKFINNQLQ
jgi:hypothetical protein